MSDDVNAIAQRIEKLGEQALREDPARFDAEDKIMQELRSMKPEEVAALHKKLETHTAFDPLPYIVLATGKNGSVSDITIHSVNPLNFPHDFAKQKSSYIKIDFDANTSTRIHERNPGNRTVTEAYMHDKHLWKADYSAPWKAITPKR